MRRKLWHFQDQLAEKIAAGNFGLLTESFPALSQADPSGAIVHAAVHSFGGVKLYWGVGVWVLAGINGLIFGIGKPTVRQKQTPCPRA